MHIKTIICFCRPKLNFEPTGCSFAKFIPNLTERNLSIPGWHERCAMCYRELNVVALKPWTTLELPQSVDKALEEVIIVHF